MNSSSFHVLFHFFSLFYFIYCLSTLYNVSYLSAPKSPILEWTASLLVPPIIIIISSRTTFFSFRSASSSLLSLVGKPVWGCLAAVDTCLPSPRGAPRRSDSVRSWGLAVIRRSRRTLWFKYVMLWWWGIHRAVQSGMRGLYAAQNIWKVATWSSRWKKVLQSFQIHGQGQKWFNRYRWILH